LRARPQARRGAASARHPRRCGQGIAAGLNITAGPMRPRRLETPTYRVHRPAGESRLPVHQVEEHFMSFSMSQTSLPTFEIGLNALSGILDKAEACAGGQKNQSALHI